MLAAAGPRRTRTLGQTHALILGLCLLPSTSLAQSPRDIIDQVDRLMRGNSSRGRIEMQIRTKHWERTLQMVAWSLGTEYSLVRVEAPVKEAGTATLKVVDEVWNYLPRVDRTIKIPPSMMMGSWMGSHFTNDDFVKESRLIEDYDIAFADFGGQERASYWDLSLTPHPDAPVVWGRIDYRVRKADLMPVWARYFDEGGALVRTMTFDQYQRMGGRLVPARMTVVPADKPEEVTLVLYQSLEFDIGVDETFFSLRNLRRSAVP